MIMKELLSIIQYGLDITDSLPNSIDQSAVIALARRQSIIPVVFRAFQKANIKNEELHTLCYQDICSYFNKDYSLNLIYSALNAAAIPFIPLKGSVLRFLYPEPWMRTSSDIDILIHEEDVDRAVGVLSEKAELEFDHRAYHDVLLTGPAVAPELHFSLKETMDNIDKVLDRVWEFAEPVDGFHYAMSPEFLIFHNVAHMSYHFSHGGLGMRPYIDLYLLRQKTVYDEAQVGKMLEEAGIDRFYSCCCRLIDVWFCDGRHDDVTERMERFCLEGGVFGSLKNAMASKKRKHSDVRYYFHRLFEDRKSLEQVYPILQKKPYLLLFFQMKRWKKGMTSSKKSVKNEIKLMSNTDRRTVEAYDALMKRVGL